MADLTKSIKNCCTATSPAGYQKCACQNAIVHGTTSSNIASGVHTSNTVTLDSGTIPDVACGDVKITAVAYIGIRGLVGTVTISDSNGNTWTADTSSTHGTLTLAVFHLHDHDLVGGDTVTFSFTSATESRAVVLNTIYTDGTVTGAIQTFNNGGGNSPGLKQFCEPSRTTDQCVLLGMYVDASSTISFISVGHMSQPIPVRRTGAGAGTGVTTTNRCVANCWFVSFTAQNLWVCVVIAFKQQDQVVCVNCASSKWPTELSYEVEHILNGSPGIFDGKTGKLYPIDSCSGVYSNGQTERVALTPYENRNGAFVDVCLHVAGTGGPLGEVIVDGSGDNWWLIIQVKPCPFTNACSCRETSHLTTNSTYIAIVYYPGAFDTSCIVWRMDSLGSALAYDSCTEAGCEDDDPVLIEYEGDVSQSGDANCTTLVADYVKVTVFE